MDDHARQAAVDSVIAALDGLPVPDALSTLTEVMAQILAGQGIASDSPAFMGFAVTLARSLPARTNALLEEAQGPREPVREDKGGG
jgi:hypothetical protein